MQMLVSAFEAAGCDDRPSSVIHIRLQAARLVVALLKIVTGPW